MLYVCSLRDEPRSRMQTYTQMLPVELYPQEVCVSHWALSFLTRRESSTGGMDGWKEGDGLSSGPLKREDRPCGAGTAASLWNCRCLFCLISLPPSGFGLFLALFHFLSLRAEMFPLFLLRPSSLRFHLRGMACFFLLALEVQSNAKLPKVGTSPTKSSHCLH